MPTVKTDRAEVFYEEAGAGVPVILVAGLAADHRHWFRAAPMLAQYCRVIMPDNRGCGQTVYEGPITIDDMADDIIAIMDSLGIEKAHLLGWSMGSHIALNAAARYPGRVSTLCLVSSYADRPARSEYILRNMAERYLAGELSGEMAGVIFNLMTRSGTWFDERKAAGKPVRSAEMPDAKQMYDQLLAVDGYNPREHAESIDIPVLSVHGLDDIMTEPRFGDALCDVIKDCEKIRIAGEGHFIPQELYIPAYMKFVSNH